MPSHFLKELRQDPASGMWMWTCTCDVGEAAALHEDAMAAFHEHQNHHKESVVITFGDRFTAHDGCTVRLAPHAPSPTSQPDGRIRLTLRMEQRVQSRDTAGEHGSIRAVHVAEVLLDRDERARLAAMLTDPAWDKGAGS